MQWKSGIAYAVKHTPQLALSLTSSPYTPIARGGSVALVHAIRSPRPPRTTTILSIARTMALSPVVGSLGVGVRPPIPPVLYKSHPRLRGYLVTSAAPTTVLPLTGVTGALPTLAPRRRMVRPLPTPSAGASGGRLSSGRLSSSYPAKLMTSPVRVFGPSWSLVAVLALGAPPAAVLPVVAWNACRVVSKSAQDWACRHRLPPPNAGERFGLLGCLCFTISPVLLPPLKDMVGTLTSLILTVSFVNPEFALETDARAAVLWRSENERQSGSLI